MVFEFQIPGFGFAECSPKVGDIAATGAGIHWGIAVPFVATAAEAAEDAQSTEVWVSVIPGGSSLFDHLNDIK